MVSKSAVIWHTTLADALVAVVDGEDKTSYLIQVSGYSYKS